MKALFLQNSHLYEFQVQHWNFLNLFNESSTTSKLVFWQQEQWPIMQSLVFNKHLLYSFCLIIGLINLSLTVYLKCLSNTQSTHYIVRAQRPFNKGKGIQLLHCKLTRKLTPQSDGKGQIITVIRIVESLQQGLTIYFFNWKFPQDLSKMFIA